MIVWAVTATVLALVIIFMWMNYRRQVKKICRQLAFLKEHKTNMSLTSELPFSELNELVDGVNVVLEQSREIKRTSQMSEDGLKETITNLSHDIRTPLTSMDGYFQLLSKCESDKEREHYIAIIQSRIGSLKDMLEELFTYAKLQNDNYELAQERIDFSKCVYDTVFSFYDDFKEKGIEPAADFCDERIFINGNEEAVHRILQNIIKNALEHGSKRITLTLCRQEDGVIFRCSNDVQFPEEIDINQIFTRFYKADSARTHSSTGLGLSIAKGLTERMNGTISATIENKIFSIEIRFKVQDITVVQLITRNK